METLTEFDEFWRAFPRREKKQAARDAFAWAMKKHNGDGTLLARILTTVAWQFALQPDTRYWQQADKWLLGMRWEDEPPLTAGERIALEQFQQWQAVNAGNDEAKTVTFSMFQRYQHAQRRAG